MPEYSLTVSGRQVFNGVLEPEIVTPSVQWYMHKEDRDVFGSIRSCAPCPAIMILKSDPHAFMSQQWQYALWAANHRMELINVQKLLHYRLAFANFTGFGDDSDPRADFFFNNNLDKKLPNLDKVRTSSRSVLTGTEVYSNAAVLGDVMHLVRMIGQRQVTSFMQARSMFTNAIINTPNVLKVKVFDSRQNPPLKPGYSYPGDISEVDPDAYLYNPKDNPEMFLVANVVNAQGEVVQFPRGATYPWIDDGLTPYSFVPHIANLGYGDILYPMWFLYKVPLGNPKPRAYRHD